VSRYVIHPPDREARVAALYATDDAEPSASWVEEDVPQPEPGVSPECEGLDEHEAAAKFFLENVAKLRVTRIPRTHNRTPDFLVDGPGEAGYIVEVAARSMNLDALGQMETVEQPLSKDAKVLEWLKAGREQCRSVDPQHERLWLLWCVAAGPFGEEVQVARIEAALYGKREGFDVSNHGAGVIAVYYARPGLLEYHREIDGVIVQLHAKVGLCPNEDSPRLERLLSCQLVAALQASVPVLLPSARGVVVPRTLDRSDEVAVQRYVQRTLSMQHFTFVSKEVHQYSFMKVALDDDSR